MARRYQLRSDGPTTEDASTGPALPPAAAAAPAPADGVGNDAGQLSSSTGEHPSNIHDADAMNVSLPPVDDEGDVLHDDEGARGPSILDESLGADYASSSDEGTYRADEREDPRSCETGGDVDERFYSGDDESVSHRAVRSESARAPISGRERLRAYRERHAKAPSGPKAMRDDPLPCTFVSEDQRRVFDLAKDKLTRSDRDKVEKREAFVRAKQREEKERRREKRKGKMPDPSNWGGAMLTDLEKDIEVQEAELKRLKALKAQSIQHNHRNATAGPSNTQRFDTPLSQSDALLDHIRKTTGGAKDHSKNRKNRKSKRHDAPSPDSDPDDGPYRSSGIRPVDQLNPGSSLGARFRALNKQSGAGGGNPSNSSSSSSSSSNPSGSPSSSSSDSSSSDSSGSSSDSNDSDSDGGDSSDSSSSSSSSESEGDRKRKRRKLNKRRSHKKKKESKGKEKEHTSSRMKPMPPPIYHGNSPNITEFDQFMNVYTMYCEDGRIPADRQVLRASQFLGGRALRFYQLQVANEVSDWTLERFFTELFNDVFPVDFIYREEKRLNDAKQRTNESVKDFAARLNLLFRNIGLEDEKSRVSKLWNGLRPSIQRDLWKAKLSPTRHSFERVMLEANAIEVSERIEVDSDHGGRRNRTSHRDNDSRRGGDSRRDGRDNRGRRHGHRDSSRNHHNRNDNESSYGRRTNGQSGHSSVKKKSDRRYGKDNRPPKRDRQRLSDKEKDELRAANKCFTCKEVGHMSNRCPQANTVASTSRSGPPGLRSYSVRFTDIDLDETERLRDELAETTETIDSLSLNCMTLDDCDSVFEVSDCEDGDSMHTFDASQEVLQFLDGIPEGADWYLLPSVSRTHSEWCAECETQHYQRVPADPQPKRRVPYRRNKSVGVPWDERTFARGNAESAKAHKQVLLKEFKDLRNTFADTSEGRERVEERLRRIENNLLRFEFDLDPHFAFLDGVDTFWDDPLAHKIVLLLGAGAAYPGDGAAQAARPIDISTRWEVRNVSRGYDERSYEIVDHLHGFQAHLPAKWAANPKFRVAEWYAERLRVHTGVVRHFDEPRRRVHVNLGELSAQRIERFMNMALPWMTTRDATRAKHFECWRIRTATGKLTRSFALRDLELNYTWRVHESIVANTKVDWLSWYWVNRAKVELTLGFPRSDLFPMSIPSIPNDVLEHEENEMEDDDSVVHVYAIGEPKAVPALQRNAARQKVFVRAVPKPTVVVVEIDGHPTRALLDSGSLGDFMSTTLVRQLQLKHIALEKPIKVQLAVQGSHTNVNYRVEPEFKYQGIRTKKSFDVINIDGYDLILGTPFLFQHKVCIGFNPTRIIIGSDTALPLKGDGLVNLESRAITTYEDNVDEVRRRLVDYARPICRNSFETPLPPLREINHTIPLIDETKQYSWRAAKCPEPLLPQWNEKRNAYIKSGRWKPSTSYNAVPMLCIRKPGSKPGDPPRLRTVVDLRERNTNTRKLTTPLPDIDGILRRLARARYRSIIDGQDAYEQIRVEPADVPKTAMNTPNGPMVSLVMQQGDTNAVATFQTIMTRLFAPYIGVFVDVYLDDIVIYSNSLRDHIEHVKIIIDILKGESFYLSEKKLRFLCSEMKVLGRIVDDEGIRMDPDKVDSLAKWKTPTNRDLLRGFLGAAGYLADDIDRVRIPMGVLHSLTSDGVPFRWTHTHQRAFEEIKNLALLCRNHHRKPLVYGKDAPPVNLVTDGCITGIAGVVSQGADWKTADVAAFFSAKLNSAQQNYAVHEIELLAGVESMMRYRDILQGVHFRWYTDHKGLTHFMHQRNLTGRQARWLEKISEFDFEIVYVPGVENILSDALSRLYSNEAPGTVRAPSEYTEHDDFDPTRLAAHGVTMPVLVGLEGESTVPVFSARVGDEPPRRRGRPPAVPAETGRAETGREFAARVAPFFTLKGPRGGGNAVASSSRVRLEDLRDERDDGGREERSDRLVIRLPARNRAPEGNSTATAQDSNESSLVPPSLIDVVQMTNDGFNLRKAIAGRYKEDSFFQIILENPRQHKNFSVSESGCIELARDYGKVLCIPNIKVEDRNVREIVISEAHAVLAHLGARKTLDYLRDYCWWKNMSDDVEAFCESCSVCRRTKPTNYKPYGPLNPLSVPGFPWESIGIDFIGPLPESKDRDASYDTITLVIDRLTGMVHLVPSRQDYTSRDVAELVFSEVYRLHGLPKSIVSDRDRLFTAGFWTHLHKLVDTTLRMSSAYHPQTDGSSERAIRTTTQMIRNCISPNQKDWVAKLPAIEFAINSARSETTGFAPFFLNYGRMPRAMIWNDAAKDEFPGVRAFANRLKMAIMAAHDSILAARVKQTRTANRKRQMVPFKCGELVYISTKNIKFPKGLARKFVPKFIGPYKITEDFNNSSFRIALPTRLKSRGVHDVFHASLLRAHIPNDDRLFPGRVDSQIWDFDDESDGSEWAVQRIVSHSGTRSNLMFEVEWMAGDRTWLPHDTVKGLEAFKEYLNELGVGNIAELPPAPLLADGVLDALQVSYIVLNDENEYIPEPPSNSPSFHSFLRTLILKSLLLFISALIIFSHLPITMSSRDLDDLGRATISPQLTTFEHEPSNQRMLILTTPYGTRLRCPTNLIRPYMAFASTITNTHSIPEPCPIGYQEFAQAFNHSKQCSYKLPVIEYDAGKSRWVIPAGIIPHYILAADNYNIHGQFIDPRLSALGALDEFHPGFVADKYITELNVAFRKAARASDDAPSNLRGRPFKERFNRSHPYNNQKRDKKADKKKAEPFIIELDDDINEAPAASSSKPKAGASAKDSEKDKMDDA